MFDARLKYKKEGNADNGSGFTNDRVEKFLDKNLITHANSFPGDHTVLGKIDR